MLNLRPSGHELEGRPGNDALGARTAGRPRERQPGILVFMGDDPRSHDSRTPAEVQPAQDSDLDAISRAVGVKPLGSLDELALDVWDSDEELDAFLADLRASRESGLA